MKVVGLVLLFLNMCLFTIIAFVYLKIHKCQLNIVLVVCFAPWVGV
jgi:hypothetical protein